MKLLDLDHLKRAAVAIWMTTLIGSVVLVATLIDGLPDVARAGSASWAVRAVTVFAVWVLAFVPGWLYVRFFGLRADALWSEYVLTLYRLGVDEPAYLPPPPSESAYATLAHAADGGRAETNIYRQKFNAYYGRKGSAGREGRRDAGVSIDTLFPVFLCTLTLAVAWSLILWNPASVLAPVEPWGTLVFGFIGGYVFALSMLVRRFYQSDLRPSAYAAVLVRLIVVLSILLVIRQLFAIDTAAGPTSHAAQYVTAFVIGFFPIVALQALQRIAAKVLRVVVPRMVPDYPLEQLDGLNIWYEARLVEEGVEDMQNLTTMNLVDVILHTRAPVGRIVDWLDQAFLLIHLEPVKTGEDAAPTTLRAGLRRLGIRSATELLHVFPTDDDLDRQAASLRRRGLDHEQLATVVRLLAEEPGLDPIRNWKGGGAGRTAPVPTVTVRAARRRRQPVAVDACQVSRVPPTAGTS